MVNSDEELSLAYLLSPTFQQVNTAGKPLTDGYIEVYIHGTRDKYYCYSDWGGTLHPFQIKLDSLGSNIVLADPSQSYDVYVYNKYGSLVMSRYNVIPVNGGDGSSALNITIESTDGTIEVNPVSAGNFDLAISDSVMNRIESLEDAINNLDTTSAYAIGHADSDNGSVFTITNDGVSGINYLSDMTGYRLKPGHVYQFNYNASFDCGEHNRYVDGKFYLEGVDTIAQDWNFSVDDSYNHDESFNGSTILVTPTNLNYYDVRLKYQLNDTYANAPDINLNKISIVDITSILQSNAGSASGTEYVGGNGIVINNENHIISVDMDYISSHLSVDIDAKVASAINVANNYTDARVTAVSGDLVELISQVSGSNVQSDWEQTDSDEPDYIKNKPNLNNYATKNELTTVSGVLQDEIDAIVIPDVSQFATHTEVNSVSSVLETEIQIVSAAIGEQVPNVSIQSPSGSLVITETVSGNNKIYSIDVAPTSGIEYGTFYGTDISGAATLYRTKGNINVNNGKIQLKKGQSYHVTVRGRYNQGTLVPETGIVSYIEYITNNSISFNVDKSISDSQYFEISYDLFNLNNDVDYYVFFTLSNAKVNDLFIDVHSLAGAGQNGSGGGSGTEYDAGWGINILNNVISVDPSILNNYVTEPTVSGIVETAIDSIPNADWNAVSGKAEILNKPSEKSLVAGAGVSIDVVGDDVIISASVTGQPVISGYVTEQEFNSTINVVTGMIPDVSDFVDSETVSAIVEAATANIPSFQQVNSDWTATSGVAEILNKPIESELIAGDGITISATGNDYVISANVTGIEGYATEQELQAVSAAIPAAQIQSDWNQTNTTAKDYIKNKPTIPAAQVQSNWTETNTSSKAYIRNKPSEYDLVAGDNITITVSGNDLVISADSAGDVTKAELIAVSGELQNEIETVSGAIPDISGLATKTELSSVSAQIPDISGLATNDDLQIVSAAIPDISDLATKQELESVSAQIPDVSNLASKTELSTASGYLQNEIDTVSGNIPDISNLATKNEVQAIANDVQIVSGAIPDVSDFVTESTLETVSGNIVNQIPDVSDFVTTSDLNDSIEQVNTDIQIVSGAIPDISGLATKTEVATASGNLDNKINNVSAAIPDVSDFVTSSQLQSVADDVQVVSAAIPDVSSYATRSEVNNVSGVLETEIQTVSSNIPDISGLATKQELNVVSGMIPDVSDFVTETTLETVSGNIVNQIPDVSNYATTQALESASGALNSKIDAVSGAIPDVSNFATETELQTVSAAIPDISNLATKQEVSNVEADVQIVSAAIPDVSSYATRSEVNTVSGTIVGMIPDVSDLATKQEVATVSGMIPDVSNLASKSELTSVSGYLQTEIEAISGVSGGGTTYTAGDHIDITNDTISVTGITELVAGNAITISTSGASAIISSTGEAQVQSDWDEGNPSSKAYIKNKPYIQTPVQSNWAETNSWDLSYIQNKPTIHTYTAASGINITNDVVSLDNPIGLVAGTNVTIEVSGSSAIISAQVSSGVTMADLVSVSGTLENQIQTVSAAIPDVSNYVTTTTLNSVSGTLETEIQVVSSAIPTVTLQSLNTANITDIQLVNAASACTGANILYLIPEA